MHEIKPPGHINWTILTFKFSYLLLISVFYIFFPTDNYETLQDDKRKGENRNNNVLCIHGEIKFEQTRP